MFFFLQITQKMSLIWVLFGRIRVDEHFRDFLCRPCKHYQPKISFSNSQDGVHRWQLAPYILLFSLLTNTIWLDMNFTLSHLVEDILLGFLRVTVSWHKNDFAHHHHYHHNQELNISNISAVTDLILTKLFWTQICGVLIFVDQHFLAQKLKAVLSITLKFSNHLPTQPPTHRKSSENCDQSSASLEFV